MPIRAFLAAALWLLLASTQAVAIDVTMSPPAPRTNDTLTATVGNVQGGDTLTFIWKVNGVIRKITPDTFTQTDSLDLSTAGNGGRGQTILAEVTPKTGATSGATVTGSAIVANTAPQASVGLNKSSPDSDDILVATATKTDLDNDLVVATFVWRVNGVIMQITPSSSGTSQYDLSKPGYGDPGQTITVEITPNDGTEDGGKSNASATVVNGAPTASISFSATAPHTNDVLTALVIASDPDGDSMTFKYVWKVDGAPVKTIASTTSFTDSLDLSVPGNGQGGQTISLEVTPSDGTAAGAVAINSVVVASTPPSATVSLNESEPNSSEVLTATATTSDIDNETVKVSYVWKVNGVVQKTTANSASLTDTFDLSVGGNGGAGDEISVEVTPNDGTLDGAMVSASANVVGSPPSAALALNTASPTTNEVLTATVQASDPDGDEVTVTYVWKVNGTTRKTTPDTNLLTDTFDLGLAGNGNRGQAITVEVTPNDGIDDGETRTASATVASTPPVANVTLSKSSPRTEEILTANATYVDDDLDPAVLTYVWKVNGNTVQIHTNLTALSDSLNLAAAGQGDAGQAITVELTANDGSGDSATVSAEAIVANTAPVITSAAKAVTTSAYAGEPISFSASATDADGQLLTFTWDFNDGTTGTGSSVQHAFPAVGTYTVVVTVSDGELTVTSSVTVTIIAPTPFIIAKAAIKFNFSAANKDSLAISGTIPLPAGFVIGGKRADIHIADYARTGLLFNTKFIAGDGKITAFKIQAKVNKLTGGIIAPPDAKYTLSLKSQTLFGPFGDLGFVNDNVSSFAVTFSARLIIDGKTYAGSRPLSYTAKKGKSGSAK